MVISFEFLLKNLKKYSGIADNSRNVKKGNIFVAIKGSKIDGSKFIGEAIIKGAKAVISEDLPGKLIDNVIYSKVPNSRKALSFLASAWYANPEKKLKVIGVTGTDGKTTTSNFIYSILKSAGIKAGLISTINAKIGSKSYDTGFHVTNPEPLLLFKFLSMMVQQKCEYVVLEVTSHGLDQDRVAGINFEVSVITNVTHEHLDYHKTYENYLKTKAKIFDISKVVYINHDDESFGMLKRYAHKNYKSFGIDKNFLPKVTIKKLSLNFPGDYNLHNSLAAASVCRELKIADKYIFEGLAKLNRLEGRLNQIKSKKPFTIYIDFAHTPNALKNVLKVLRPQTKGNLIVVCGSAGERDKTKRPMMAKIAIQGADLAIFTAEDPRTENINNILNDMAKGVSDSSKKYYKIPERGEAISFSIQKLARKDDTIVICGKGHEKTMAYNGIEYPWSDKEAVKIALRGGIKIIKR